MAPNDWDKDFCDERHRITELGIKDLKAKTEKIEGRIFGLMMLALGQMFGIIMTLVGVFLKLKGQ